jgi:hypothetical protein
MKFSQKIVDNLNHHCFDFTLADKIDESLDFNYIDYSTEDETKLSYINKSRFSLFEGEYWDRDNRNKWAVQVKPHKLLKQIFHRLDENEINQVYQVLFKCEKKHIEVWEADKLPSIYDNKLIYTDSGNLRSCMVQHHDLRKFQIYQDHCKAVVLVDTLGKINARAILWLNAIDEDDKPIVYLDRIYSRTQEDNDQIKNWAIEQKYSYRHDNDPSYFKYLGENEGYHLKVELIKDADEYELLPYMDSFKFGERGSDIISTNENDGYIKLEDYQTGRPFKLALCGCGNCDRELDEDNTTTLNGVRYHEECDAVCYSSRYGNYILSSCSHYCEYAESTIYDNDDDFVTTFDDTEVLVSDCIRLEGGEHGGEWCLRRDARRCDVCNNWLHEDEDDCCEVEVEEEEEVVVEQTLQVEMPALSEVEMDLANAE